jgi:hypothetical protein
MLVMSKMQPFDFFDAFVIPDHEDWRKEPSSIRLAFHVATSAFHLADHYFQFYSRQDAAFGAKYKNLEKFQDALVARTPAFKVVQDVANTFKHLYPRARCSISSGGAIESIEDGDLEMQSDWEDNGAHPKGDVSIRHKDGSTTRFSKSIGDVYSMWSDIFSGNGPAAV